MNPEEKIELLKRLFKEKFNIVPEVKKLSGGGSPREYFRLLSESVSVIGVYSENIVENLTFLRLTQYLSSKGINVPAILAKGKNNNCYLLQDLGDELLFSLFLKDNKIKYAETALSELIKFQTLPKNEWENIVGYKPFSSRLVKWDLNYFKYDFLKPIGLDFDEEKLEDDFEKLSETLLSTDNITGLMYRDFQSRNIMVFKDKFWFIDFQGARMGPLTYDAASFIWQAKAPFTYTEREALGEFYIKTLASLGYEIKKLQVQLKNMIVFRTLQVLGAYGFRGLIERKKHFIQSIPFAIKNLHYLKEKGYLDDYPEIKRMADELKNQSQGKEATQSFSNLTVTVYSFSYKKGYPEDTSGNGGGFIFDCRAIHNPGRYDQYKALTGRDQNVIEFLERTDEASNFVDHAINIVTPSVKRYLEREFTSLLVGFGCTGGQHRSVYCAEQFAKKIKEIFPMVNVDLFHREQSK